MALAAVTFIWFSSPAATFAKGAVVQVGLPLCAHPLFRLGRRLGRGGLTLQGRQLKANRRPPG